MKLDLSTKNRILQMKQKRISIRFLEGCNELTLKDLLQYSRIIEDVETESEIMRIFRERKINKILE